MDEQEMTPEEIRLATREMTGMMVTVESLTKRRREISQRIDWLETKIRERAEELRKALDGGGRIE